MTSERLAELHHAFSTRTMPMLGDQGLWGLAQELLSEVTRQQAIIASLMPGDAGREPVGYSGILPTFYGSAGFPAEGEDQRLCERLRDAENEKVGTVQVVDVALLQRLADSAKPDCSPEDPYHRGTPHFDDGFD